MIRKALIVWLLLASPTLAVEPAPDKPPEIVLTLSVEEANALARLMDAGLRQLGIGEAKIAAALFEKLKEAAAKP